MRFHAVLFCNLPALAAAAAVADHAGRARQSSSCRRAAAAAARCSARRRMEASEPASQLEWPDHWTGHSPASARALGVSFGSSIDRRLARRYRPTLGAAASRRVAAHREPGFDAAPPPLQSSPAERPAQNRSGRLASRSHGNGESGANNK